MDQSIIGKAYVSGSCWTTHTGTGRRKSAIPGLAFLILEKKDPGFSGSNQNSVKRISFHISFFFKKKDPKAC